MANLGITGRIAQQHTKLTNFFHTPAATTIAQTTGKTVVNENLAKYALRQTGSTINNQIYKIGSKLGASLAGLLDKTEGLTGFIGKNLSKVPGLKSFANNLSNISSGSTNKIPGLGTLLVIANGLYGAGVALKRAFEGDIQGSGHQILKTTGSVIGAAAGLAIAATGIGVIPGLLLATATGFAGDYIGKSVANMMFPEVKAREDLEKELKKSKIYG